MKGLRPDDQGGRQSRLGEMRVSSLMARLRCLIKALAAAMARGTAASRIKYLVGISWFQEWG